MHGCGPREIGELFPAGVCFAGGPLHGLEGGLYPEEEASLRHAVEKRRIEFRAGRHYARQALAALGVSPTSLPVGKARAPLWPEGIVGSISHSATYCGAAVARDRTLAAIGFDVEDAAPLPDELVSLVCSPAELAARRTTEAISGLDLPRLLFSVKESVYKCHYPMTATFLNFEDVHVRVNAERHIFLATVHAVSRAAGPGAITVVEGRFGSWHGLVFSSAFVRA